MSISLLLADDSPTIAKILGMALQSEDYEIRSVLTADEALRELKAKPPFFFLVDLSLPGKDGFAFAELIRADSKLNKIKIVFLSSAFEPVDEAAVKKSGADLVIAKPFDPSELRASLRQLRDAPPKFPSGAKVQGALSGQVVTAPAGGGNTSLTDTGLRAAREVISGTTPAPKADDLLLGLTNDLDANSILAGLDGISPPPTADAGAPALDLDIGVSGDVPPPMPAQKAAAQNLGLDASDLPSPTTNPTLDLTGAFALGENALENLAATPSLPPASPPPAREEPPAFAPKAPPPAAAPPSAPPKAPAAAGLSANAEALAAFFAAEIDSKQPAASSPPPPPPASVPTATPEEFEKSMASIEWDNSAPADLDAWSSQPMSAPPPVAPPTQNAAPAPAPRPAAPASPKAAPREATRSIMAPNRTDHAGPASFMFDTGDSNFRFAEDYITRITKSFTGQHNEEVPERHEPMFPQRSDDTPPPAAAPAAGLGGAWNPVDAGKMEQIVREEVQMAVREIVEKVAWEVIPELAENIIKRELEKVMKQLEANS